MCSILLITHEKVPIEQRKRKLFVCSSEPATGGATRIIKSENIVDSRRRVSVRCLGHPSYPDGNLKFQVKMKDELAFQDFAFPLKIKNELSDDCSRTQTMDIDYDFDTFWDQAVIRCLEEDSGNLDDTVLDIIPGLKLSFLATLTILFVISTGR